MKVNLITIFFLLFGLTGHSQIMKEQKLSLPDGSKLTYQTISGKLNGIYSVDKEGINLLRGNYVNEKRVGNWYLFNRDKSLFARYNYDAKKLLYIDYNTLALATVKVNSGDPDIDKKASVPFPIVSLEQYFTLLTNLAESVIPHNDLYKIDKNSAQIIANISSKGEAFYSITYELNGVQGVQKLSLDKYLPFYIEWMPAIYDGIGYSSEFVIKTNLSPTSTGGNHKRFNWF